MERSSFFMPAPANIYRERRARLARDLDRPMVIFAGRARPRHYATNTYPFRASSCYLYFGGPPIKGAVWLIEPGSNGEQGSTLLRPVLDFDEAVWNGDPPSDQSIAAAAGVWPTSLQTPDSLETLLRDRTAAYLAPPCSATQSVLKSLRVEPADPDELQLIIHLRFTKDEHELAAMQRAVDTAVQAHLAAMETTASGHTEAEVAAALTAVFVAHHAIPSFSPIVTVRGDILHCEEYTNTIEAGQLMLIDAGAEEPGGYASDITRTYPVTGEFTPIQRQLYDTVLRAEREAIAACVPGRRYRDIHDLAARIICEGLVEAELLRGDPAELCARSAHTVFFTHGVGHLIGLDVHDMEEFGDLAGYAPGRKRRPTFGDKFLRLDRDLEENMVVTIEPGVYFVPAIWQNEQITGRFADVVNRSAVNALLKERFGGIRIEDVVHVRSADAAPGVLTADAPTEPDALAAVVGGN